MLFFRRGRSGAIFAPVITNLAAPTVAHLTAGTKLSTAVTGISGFEVTPNRVATPVMAYAEELQLSSGDTFGDASITLLEDDGTGTDADGLARKAAYLALDVGSSGYIVLSVNKVNPIAASAVEVWPVTVSTRSRSFDLGNNAATYVVSFNVTGSPETDGVVAA